jgi:hypothetical protein
LNASSTRAIRLMKLFTLPSLRSAPAANGLAEHLPALCRSACIYFSILQAFLRRHEAVAIPLLLAQLE